jgi:hypothetical protein
VSKVLVAFGEEMTQFEYVVENAFVDDGASYTGFRELRQDKVSNKYWHMSPPNAFAHVVVTNNFTIAERGLAWTYLDKNKPSNAHGWGWHGYVCFGTCDF